MNVYFREIKSHWKGFLGWSAAIAFTIVSGMVKFQGYNTASGKSSIGELLKTFPKPILAIFGMSGLDVTKMIGYVGIMYLYIVLIAAIYAALAGAEIISKEELDKTSEFLYPKPVSRSRVLTEKILAAATYQLLFFVVAVITNIWIVDYYNSGDSLTPQVMTLMWGVLLFQLVSFSFGVFFAGIFKNPKLPTAAVTTVVVSSYLLSVFIDINASLDFLKPLTPFQYFGAPKIIAESQLDPIYVVMVLAISALLFALTYYFYNNRDLTI